MRGSGRRLSVMTEPSSAAGFTPSRRAFLTGACALAAAGIAGAVLVEPAEAASAISALTNGKVKITVAKVKALKKDGGVALIGMVGEAQAAVMRVNATTYVALDLSCPHAGVTVKKSSGGWSCPAHGSQFSSTGALQRGPARRGLAKLPSVFSKGILIVG